jgi:hypothetical protein
MVIVLWLAQGDGMGLRTSFIQTGKPGKLWSHRATYGWVALGSHPEYRAKQESGRAHVDPPLFA